MGDSRELEAAERYARSTPLNWAVVGAGIERGLISRRRIRRRLQGTGAALVIGCAVAAITLGAVGDETPRRTIEPAERTFDTTSSLRLVEACSRELSSGAATESALVVSPDGLFAAALVRDAEKALMCASSDPGAESVDADEVELPVRIGPRKQEVAWQAVRLGDSTYIGAMVAEDTTGPWVGGSDFVLGNRQKRLDQDETLNIVLVQRPRPLEPQQYLVFGLLDERGCECGAVLQMTDDMFDLP